MRSVAKMNVQRLTKIAEWLEAGAPHVGIVTGFDMQNFIREGDAIGTNECGTSCCIAGAAVQFKQQREHRRRYRNTSELVGMLWENEKLRSEYGNSSEHHEAAFLARKDLGLTADQARKLFYGNYKQRRCWRQIPLHEINAAWAARTIRHLIKTGKVDWIKTAPKGSPYRLVRE